jgi:hypothetical protein
MCKAQYYLRLANLAKPFSSGANGPGQKISKLPRQIRWFLNRGRYGHTPCTVMTGANPKKGNRYSPWLHPHKKFCDPEYLGARPWPIAAADRDWRETA